VDEGDQVRANGSREDSWELQSSLGGRAINVVNGNQRARLEEFVKIRKIRDYFFTNKNDKGSLQRERIRLRLTIS
jgi:hypothetical protein